MASTNKGISGIAVAALAFGAVFIWSGIQNQSLVTSLRSLAMGQPIPVGYKAGARDLSQPHGGDRKGSITAEGSRIVSMAASYKGFPYKFGGGHRVVCPQWDDGMDCSGYVSCVMNKVGLMNGTLTTDGFASWGTKVPFLLRQPGDIVVWIGGPGSGHMGIVIDDNTMWHNPCTGCGGVQIGTYGSTRTGRKTIVRRPEYG